MKGIPYMKKTLRRSLACLLAVLMVAFSMPFTSFAAYAGNGWWGDTNYDGADNKSIPYGEQAYNGWNSDDWQLGFMFEDAVAFQNDLEMGEDAYAMMANYKPVLTVTVSDQGTADNRIYRQYYGYSEDYTIDSVRDAGHIINPAELKAGMRIAVTFEIGGFDMLYDGQLKGMIDPEYLAFGYYRLNPASADRWTQTSNTQTSQAWITRGYAFYGTALTDAGSQYASNETHMFYTPFTSNAQVPASSFVGDRPYGDNGLVIGTLSLEVLKDCDLSDVITFTEDIDNSPIYGTTYFAPYAAGQATDTTAQRFTFDTEDTTWSYGLIALQYTDYVAGGGEDPVTQYTVKFENYAGDTVSETKYDEGTAASSVAVPENTAASSDDENHYTYAWPTITDVTGDVTYKETRTETAHDWVKDTEASTEPTCTDAGHYVYKCSVGGETYEEYPTALGHSFTDYVYNNDATCQADGTETAKCDRCDATDTRTAAGTKVDHSYGEYVYNNDATCTEDGTETASCIYGCGTTDTRTAADTATGHDWGEWKVTKEPTYEEAGEETRVCKNDPSHTETRTVPALKGISVTVESVDLGTATLNGEDVTTEDVQINVAANSDVTLTATPVAGAEFVGWEVNGKIVSTEATYTAKALANIVYTPVFQLVEDTEANNFTVVFTDKFGNVISTQTVASGADIVIPEVPVVAGYTAAGWSLSDEEIKALTEATTITAKYDRIVEDTYTVTATGATITTPYAETEDVNTGIGYNTLVTVYADGATAWKMGDTTVAYGDTYSFYIGNDMELTPVYDVVTATPTVAAVSVTETGSTGKIGASFLATREMTDDCTYVNAGYIYGKDLDNQEITLADVDGSTVKAIYCATESNQFALNYGISAQTGTIVARAFLAYVDADGATQVVYAEPQTYTYA